MIDSPSPTRARTAPRALITALVVIALTLVAFVRPTPLAWGALVEGAVKSITITDGSGNPITEVVPGGRIRTNVEWCAPAGTKAGDSFTITLPPQLNNYPAGFPLHENGDPDGPLVASATIEGNVATITFTDYVETKANVCGTAYFDGMMRSEYAGTKQTLTYTTNDGKEFSDDVTVTEVVTVDRTGPFKVGRFNESDQCRSDGSHCIRWSAQTPTGPGTDVVLKDRLGNASGGASVGQTFECSTLSVVVGTPTNTFPYITDTSPVSNYTVRSCDDKTFEVVIDSVPAGKIAQVTLDVTAPTSPVGGITYPNTVVTSSSEEPTEKTFTAYISSSGAGGEGNGDSITLTKWATSDGPTDGDFDTAPGKLVKPGDPVDVTITITNNGRTALRSIKVTDATITGPDLTGLSCTFPDGSTGTTWAGPLEIGEDFTCTGVVPAMAAGTQHTDNAKVTATGNGEVQAENPFNTYTEDQPSPSPTPTPSQSTPTSPSPSPSQPMSPSPSPSTPGIHRVNTGDPGDGSVNGGLLGLGAALLLAGAGALIARRRMTAGSDETS